jgi:hypothetical protein
MYQPRGETDPERVLQDPSENLSSLASGLSLCWQKGGPRCPRVEGYDRPPSIDVRRSKTDARQMSGACTSRPRDRISRLKSLATAGSTSWSVRRRRSCRSPFTRRLLGLPHSETPNRARIGIVMPVFKICWPSIPESRVSILPSTSLDLGATCSRLLPLANVSRNLPMDIE